MKRWQFAWDSRRISIGDLHGDLLKTKQSFRLSSLIDSSDLVQVVDVLDRCADKLKILYFLENLICEATRVGCHVISLNGNHEIMNIEGDFSYATKEGLHEFRLWAHWFSIGRRIKSLCPGLDQPPDPFSGIPHTFPGIGDDILDGIRARIAALRSRGPIFVRFLAENVTVAMVGISVFVHGGLLAEHVSVGLERINEEVREWIIGGSKGKASDHC